MTNVQKGKTKAKTTANGKAKPPQPETSSMTERQKEKAERQKANSAEITEAEPTGATSASASSQTWTPNQEKQKLPGSASHHEPKSEVEPNGPSPNGRNWFPPISSSPWSIHPIHPHVVTCPLSLVVVIYHHILRQHNTPWDPLADSCKIIVCHLGAKIPGERFICSDDFFSSCATQIASSFPLTS